MLKKIFLLLLFLAISSVFYFSWLPDPSFKNQTYLPKWLLDWSNKYYNLRTAVPFLGIGFLLEAYYHQVSTNNFNHNKYLYFIKSIVISAVIVCIAEIGQFFIQGRNQDLADIFYGIMGSSTGALVYILFKNNRYEK